MVMNPGPLQLKVSLYHTHTKRKTFKAYISETNGPLDERARHVIFHLLSIDPIFIEIRDPSLMTSSS
jgi:hypothetical protein